MAPSNDVSVKVSEKIVVFNDKWCKKCAKIVRNGVLCNNCDKYWHFRCGKVDSALIEDLNETTWYCMECNGTEISGPQSATNRACNPLEVEVKNLRAIIKTLQDDIRTLEHQLNERNITSNSNSELPRHESNGGQECNTGWQADKRGRNRRTAQYLRDSWPPLPNNGNLGLLPVPVSNRYDQLQVDDSGTTNVQANIKSTRSSPKRKCSTKKCGKILICGDSHARGFAERLKFKHMDTVGMVKPGATTSHVLQGIADERHTKNDYCVVMTGTNDVAKNESEKAIANLRSTLGKLSHTNVIVVNIPKRHDLAAFSCVNQEVDKTNAKINKLCRRFQYVSVVDAANLERELHTRHGLHLNSIGKDHLAANIISVIMDNINLQNKHARPIVINNEGN